MINPRKLEVYFLIACSISLPEANSGVVSTTGDVGLVGTADKVMGIVELGRMPFTCTGTAELGN